MDQTAKDVILRTLEEVKCGARTMDAATEIDIALTGAGYEVLPRDQIIGLCPFSDPKFDIAIDEPCPKCGMLGHIDAEDKCIDTMTRLRKRIGALGC